MTYLTPRNEQISKVVWPQDHLIYRGPMMKAEALGGAEVLATVTLPWVAPELGHSIGSHFASIHSNPPALVPGTNSGAGDQFLWQREIGLARRAH